MRLYLTLTPNTEPVSFGYQQSLIGALHKWIGCNSVHDDVSLYSLSWLQRGRMRGDSLDFPDGSCMFVSCYDDALLQRIKDGIEDDNGVCYGMNVVSTQMQPAPAFGSSMRFRLDSPVLIRRRRDDGKIEHVTYDDPDADALLTQTLETKLKRASLSHRASVRFDKSYANAKTKLVTLHGIQNRANVCPVIVEGDPAAVSFAWDVGVGHCTGCGFGALQ